MSSLKELARLMKELEDQLVVCMRCGLCQAVCPLFAETGREADVARGKLALLDGLAQEILKNPQGVQDRLNRCLLCGSCAANCPSGVKVLDIFIKARAILAGYMGLSPVKKAIFRGLLSQPDWFNRIMAWGAKFQGIFVKPVDDLLGSSCARFLSPLLSGPALQTPGARSPGTSRSPGWTPPPGPAASRWPSSWAASSTRSFPRWARPCSRSWSTTGWGSFSPPARAAAAFRPCPAATPRPFGKLVRHNLELFDDPAASCDYLVTACATCTSTIKKMWPLMCQDAAPAEQARIAALAAKTLDISQFLVDKLGVAPGAAEPGGRPDSHNLPRSLPSEKIPGGGGPAPGPAPGQPRAISSRKWPSPTGAAAAAAASICSTTRSRRPSASASGKTSPHPAAGWWPPAAPPACCRSPTCCPRPGCGCR